MSFTFWLYSYNNLTKGDNFMNVLNVAISGHKIYNFIEDSVIALINRFPNLRSDKRYWLFYFIKDNYKANVQYISSVDADNEIFGFVPVWRNTRNSIEAFYDLINLNFDPAYLSVLEYGSKIGEYNDKFSRFTYKGNFTIRSKQNISFEYCGIEKNPLLSEIAAESNKYVHPNVFVNIFQLNELEKKEALLRKLLMANIYLLTEAYKIVLQGYNQNLQPTLPCLNCFTRNCNLCYQNLYQDYIRWIEGRLFVFLNPNPNLYSFQA